MSNQITLEEIREKVGGVISTGDFGFEREPYLKTQAEIGNSSYSISVFLSDDAQDGVRVKGPSSRQVESENYVRKLSGLPLFVGPVPKPANDNKIPAVVEKALPIIDPCDWQGKPIKPREWFVENLIPAGVPTLFSGDGGTGKSQLALQLIAASALQVEWLGLKVSEGPCLYYGAEDSADELHRRFASIVSHYQRKLSDLKDVRLVSMAEHDAVLANPDRLGQMKATKVMEKLCELAVDFKPKLIVIDTSADAFGGDEIKRVQVRQFITMLRQIAIGIDSAILLLSHPSLTGMSSGTGLSGSTAWNNSVRSRLYLKRNASDSGSDYQTRTLSVEKSNYALTGDKLELRWKDGVFVLDGGQDVSVTALVEAKAEKVFLEMLDLFSAQGQNVGLTSGKSYAPAKMIKHPKAKGMTTSLQLEAAMQRLLDRGVIKNVGFGPPSRTRYRLELAAKKEAASD